jgi:hypothetical protein
MSSETQSIGLALSSHHPPGSADQLLEICTILKQLRDKPHPSPTPTEGERVIKWFESFISATIAISILGVTITFTTLVSQLQDPSALDASNASTLTPTSFDRETVRLFIAISWLLFVVALGLATCLSLVLNAARREIETALTANALVPVTAHLISLALQGCLFGAFLFFSLTVAAYCRAVGFTAVGLTASFALAAFVVWAIQSVRWLRHRMELRL